MSRLASGLTIFLQEPPQWARGSRLGLLCHPASVAPDLTNARELIARQFSGQLKVLFSPQHGLLGEKQDNMIASADFVDPILHLPVVSLYGPRMSPPADALALADVILVDLMDVGTRVYTFAATLAKVMEAAAPLDKKVVVLDRPNPIGGTQVEGNMLQPEWASFVGPYPLPMRHGFSLGELARYYNVTQKIGCDLEVIEARGWRRGDYYDATGLPWVLPSPNLPTLDGAIVYPGQVLLEGTNLSEGRGTTRPFELFGAPFLEPGRILDQLKGIELPGVILRTACFEPTFHKWAGELCQGFQLHITDRLTFKPYYTTLALLAAIRQLYPDRFAWRQPPYEYETVRLPFDLLTGDDAIRRGLENGLSVPELEHAWQDDLTQFLEIRREFFLYGDL
ncbi:MAG: exo-beta-N-acetylmuramidase NamZ family protein [Thermodesulfobacteriota bacterium]